MTITSTGAIIALLLIPLSAWGGEKVTLRCPERGWAEVTFHLFQHVSVLWENNTFYISDARRSQNGHFYTFTNGDILVVDKGFSFIYFDSRRANSCTLISRTPTQVARLENNG